MTICFKYQGRGRSGGFFNNKSNKYPFKVRYLCSDLVPTISLVGSAGGIFTIGAAPALGLTGIGAGGGRELIGAAGTGGGGGGVLGIGAAAAGAGEGGRGAAAAGAGAAGAGAAASFLGGAAPAAPTLILRRTVPGDTVDPSSTNNSAITPDTDDGT